MFTGQPPDYVERTHQVVMEKQREEKISMLECENNILIRTTSLHSQEKTVTQDTTIETETVLP